MIDPNMPRDLLTTLSLAALTLLSLVATVLAFAPRPAEGRPDRRRQQQDLLVLIGVVGCAALFLYRWLYLRGAWLPLQSHVDGLLLISALLGATVLYLERRAHVPGLAAFALPLLTLVQAWSICASYWTFEPFQIDSTWNTLHLAVVYVGTIFLSIGAVAGGMYLFVQHQLRDKRDLPALGRTASLESIERTIIGATGLGFALLTLGLVTGFIIAISVPNNFLGPDWWRSPKVLLATATWLTYAVFLNVRRATLFRGARAAWLSILGIVLMLTTFGVVSSMDMRAGQRHAGPGALPVRNPPAVSETR